MTGGIDYEALTQQAMRGVLRAVLTGVARTGLPGEHHFYIAFDTRYPGVSLSRRLKEKYPEEMTIVLQHRFWDLAVNDETVEVKLTFDGIPERLLVPFEAVRVFFDPSVRFSLQFDDPSSFEQSLDSEPAARRRPRNRPQRRPSGHPTPIHSVSSDGRLGGEGEEDSTRAVQEAERANKTDKVPGERTLEPLTLRRPMHGTEPPPADRSIDEPAEPAKGPAPGAKIFSLDAFRKK